MQSVAKIKTGENKRTGLTIEKSERVAFCHNRRASVPRCDNGHVLLARFFDVKFQKHVVLEHGTDQVFPPLLRALCVAGVCVFKLYPAEWL